MIKCFYIFIFIGILFMGCKPSPPSGVLSSGMLEDVLYDYHLAQSVAELGQDDIEKHRYLLIQSVFKKYGITEAEFDSTMVWYSVNSKKLTQIYQRVYNRFESESKGLGVGLSDTQLYSNMSNEGDTANIWMGPSLICLQNDNIHNIISLTLNSDSSFVRGDNFKLSFSSDFIGLGHREAFAFLIINYSDGTTNAVSNRINGKRDVILELPRKLDNLSIHDITIIFFFPVDITASCHSCFFVTNPALIRLHPQKPVTSSEKSNSTVLNDTLHIDSVYPRLQIDSGCDMRLSPKEFRDSSMKNVKSEIHVVKERHYRRISTSKYKK